MGGTKDYNRYSSALAADRIGKKNAIYRPYVGTHSTPSDLVATEAYVWLYTLDIYKTKKPARPKSPVLKLVF